MEIRVYPLIRSIANFFLPSKIMARAGSGGSYSAEYCYSVWLRHIIHMKNSGLINSLSNFKSVAEIGPGDSLGFGLSALLSGAERYYAFDVIEHANLERNINVVLQLENFFKKKMPIPHKGDLFRNTKPILDDYSFPQEIYKDNDNFKEKASNIIEALKGNNSNVTVEYVVPWNSSVAGKPTENISQSVDLIFSQAVMEHIMDIEGAYKAMYKWLKPGGIISHQIDYKAHEMSNYWDGHWFIPKKYWDFLLSGRKYPINRFPHSAHISAIEKAGFSIKNVVKDFKEESFPERELKAPYKAFDNEDKLTGSALIQAIKK